MVLDARPSSIHRLDDADRSALASATLCAPSPLACLRVGGEGARNYLQGQITRNVAGLADDRGLHAAVLTPRGKPVAELFLLVLDEALLLLAEAARAETLLARLRRFSIGHAVTIEPAPELAVLALRGGGERQALAQPDLPRPDETPWAARSRGDTAALRLPGSAPRGLLLAGPAEELTPRRAELAGGRDATEALEALRILDGFPRFGVDWDESDYPLHANLDLTDGVDFDKGCYIGQEVVSRMRWRGTIRKRLYRLRLDAPPEALPAPIECDGTAVGRLTSCAIDADGSCHGLGRLPVASAGKEDAALTVAGAPARVVAPCGGMFPAGTE